MASTLGMTIVSGYVGSDAEIRYLPNGTAVANFSLPHSKEWKDQNGEKKQKTVWYRVSVWGKQAEGLAPYIKKGIYVIVRGELDDPNAYIDKNGDAKAQNQLRLDEFIFGPRVNGGNEVASDAPAGEPAPAAEGVVDF